jgi:hypothetical protein
VPVQYSYTSTPPIGRTACTEPQCRVQYYKFVLKQLAVNKQVAVFKQFALNKQHAVNKQLTVNKQLAVNKQLTVNKQLSVNKHTPRKYNNRTELITISGHII